MSVIAIAIAIEIHAVESEIIDRADLDAPARAIGIVVKIEIISLSSTF